MKRYIGTKLISATPMTLGDYNKLREWEMPSKEKASIEGYLVEYSDSGKPNHEDFQGYISWSPKDVFERSYRQTSGGVPYGLAIEATKKGMKVARYAWDGCNGFIYYVPESSYPASRNVKETLRGHFESDLVPYTAYLAHKTHANVVTPYVPTMDDMLKDDWYIWINNPK